MKTYNFPLLRLIAVFAIIVNLWSCSKDEVKPAGTVSYSEQQLLSESVLPGEITAATVSPGVYRIAKFIDTGDDETAQFNGYTFRFRANGRLIATTRNGAMFNGTWSLNSAGTMMEINISGNKALEDLDDDDWRVNILTTTRIRLSAAGPDVVVFVKI
jgi:hypothetical protein